MDRNWGLTLGVGIVTGWAIGVVQPGEGRPVPDETLGEERSQVIDRSSRDFDIDGGARRGGQLFHRRDGWLLV